MPIRPSSPGLLLSKAMPWRLLSHRFSFLLFIALAFSMLIMDRVKPIAVENFRSHAIDGIAPILDAFASPLTAIDKTSHSIKNYLALREENEKLRADLNQLKEWQDTVTNLQSENRQLHDLLHFKVEPGLAYVSARVIADTGGPFVRSMIITAGSIDGAREGMAVMAGEGLIGRVIEVGSWSSRVLLLTDLNSRIPVTILGSNDRAIMAGDNSPTPRLLYLPMDNMVKVGMTVVTSGHGGVFPPNLPIGTVSLIARGVYGIVPASDLSRINYVRLVDFSLEGGAFNPANALLNPTKAKR